MKQIENNLDANESEGVLKDKENALVNSDAADLIDLNGFYEKLNLLDDDLRNSDEFEGEKEPNFLQGGEINKNWEGG